MLVVARKLLYIFTFPCPISTLAVFLERKRPFGMLNSVYFHPLVLQEEVLPSGPAGRRILQPQLLQRREHLQGTQGNHLPRLMHGGRSGKGPHTNSPRPLKLLGKCMKSKFAFCFYFRTAKCVGLPSS